MRGLATPTAIAMSDPRSAGVSPELDRRFPFDPAAARKLLADAGYPSGFGFTLNCPNDRYVNDEKICLALAAMWARVGVRVRVATTTRAVYFQKMGKLDTSAFMIGWGGGSPDAIFLLKPVLHSRNALGAGDANYGNFTHPKLDQLIEAIESEMDPARRAVMVNDALRIVQDEVLVIPLHRQVVAWVSRAHVSVVHRPSNWLIAHWVTVR